MTHLGDPTISISDFVLRMVSAAPPAGQPIAVVIMGGVAAGKTSLRKEKYSSGYVLIDAADIFLSLSNGEHLDFPDALGKPMEQIGSSVALRALSERRPIVTEIIGADKSETIELIESLKAVGYEVQIAAVTCDLEESIERNESRGPDDISAYYAEKFQMRWLVTACRTIVSDSTSNSDKATVELAGARVFEDADYLLFKKHGVLGVRHPMLTTLYVQIKSRGVTVKATGKEKRFLLAAVGWMAKSGSSPAMIKDSAIFSEFCGAVASRPGIRWQAFFKTGSPALVASTYART